MIHRPFRVQNYRFSDLNRAPDECISNLFFWTNLWYEVVNFKPYIIHTFLDKVYSVNQRIVSNLVY